MNDWAMYKPVLTALALPPVPFLIVILLGARLILSRRGLGHLLVFMGVTGIWLSACEGTANLILTHVLQPVPPLTGGSLADLGKRKATAAIIVLGGGRDALAAEYGMADLSTNSAERLRYGVWLSRQTGVPLGFSGGIGWAQKGAGIGASEAEVAARISKDMYGLPLRWTESESSDTRENAFRTISLLSGRGVREVVVVTHAFHMRRARTVFEEAARRSASAEVIKITPAPMGFWGPADRPLLDWLPSATGMVNVHHALRECLGLLVRA